MRFTKDESGAYPAFAWPGGYPVYYVLLDGGVLCSKCANDPTNPVHSCAAQQTPISDKPAGNRCREYDSQWCVVDGDENWEDPALYCDHFEERIPSAYSEPDKASQADPTDESGKTEQEG